MLMLANIVVVSAECRWLANGSPPLLRGLEVLTRLHLHLTCQNVKTAI